MPSQEELLAEQRLNDLRDFASEKEVDISGLTTKQEITDKLVASKKVTAAEVRDRFGNGGTTDTSPRDAGRVTRRPEAVGDPALGNVRDLVAPRAEGRTSDPATRTADTRAADVEPDINVGPKQSDAGPDAYPFPPGGDVDVALVDPGRGAGEYMPPLNVDDWVILDGSHELVPDRLDGHMAFVVDAPNQLAPDVHDHPNAARSVVPDAAITVRTRDEVDATLHLPLEAFKRVGKGGRTAVLPVG